MLIKEVELELVLMEAGKTDRKKNYIISKNNRIKIKKDSEAKLSIKSYVGSTPFILIGLKTSAFCNEPIS